MAKRFARKVKRAGKSATQFRFTSTFEYVDLTCNGTWRPGNLRVIWLRSHRRVQSSDVEFVVTEDRGPNGADGRAVFDPPISASLIVTLYRDGKKQEFEEKEYKYYIENEDKNGKKILASFNCDMAEYAGIPSARHALEMNFKPVSRKISKSLLGITLEAEFQKEGKDTDDDMQSTFSSVDPSQSVMYADDEDDVDDEELDEAATLGMSPKSPEKEEEEEDTPATNQEDEPDKQPSTEPQDGTAPQGANPFDDPGKEQSPPPTSPGRNAALVSTWLPDAQYVDCHDVGVGKERVDSADVIGLYFSAQWCPPCRRFLPKLLEFYTSLKKNNKSFEMIYISNDNSRTEMIQYMAEQQMPWVAIPHGHPLIDKLKLDFKVRSIPLLVIVSASGETLDDNAKKVVEGTHVAASSTIKQYNKWLEKAGKSPDDEEKPKTGGGGIIGSIKKALGGKDDETPPTSPATETQHVREVTESKSHKTTVNDKHSKDELLRQLQQKEDIIRHLEEVNQSLKITNDELNTEVRTLKTGLEQSEIKVRELEASTAQKRQEDEKLREHLKVQGWLFKKGAKGPTANVFRRRYFRLDQGSRLYYYKSQSEGTPQGFIDLAKVIEVSPADASKQDKNNGSFNINCEGRVFELLAHDETEMNKWISAITYLAKYFKEKGASPN